MIVDSSALVAVACKEPGYHLLLDVLSTEGYVGIGTPTLVETGMLLSRRLGRDAEGLTNRMREEFELEEIAFGDQHRHEALAASWRFGAGRHAAGFDLGDCCSYAVARLSHEPLLYIGGGFKLTDILRA
jgi:ribonuclease VapC